MDQNIPFGLLSEHHLDMYTFQVYTVFFTLQKKQPEKFECIHCFRLIPTGIFRLMGSGRKYQEIEFLGIFRKHSPKNW